MDLNRQKELFSDAFILAIAAAAGIGHSKPHPDEGMDWTLRSDRDSRFPNQPLLDVQLKCTELGWTAEERLVYDLGIKNYDDLRRTTMVPRILVVVFVPNQVERWIVPGDDSLSLSHAAFWVSLADKPATANTSSVRIDLPRHHSFTPESLLSIMRQLDLQLAKGERLLLSNEEPGS